ncbi:alpha-(1,3)-fucosyltransferase 10 isoform X2 [Anticarsia gemmatalis]
MDKQLKYYVNVIKLSALNMLRKMTRGLVRVTLRELFLILLALFFCVLWMFSDVSVKDVDKHKTSNKYPVILWWTKEFPGTSELKHCSNNAKCYVYSDRDKEKLYDIGAYLFYASNLDFEDLPLPRRPSDIIWGLFHEESPRNVEELLHEKALNLFNFSTTFSRYSDVPFPLHHLNNFGDITSTKYFVNTSTKNKLLEEIAPIMYLQSDCETSTERDAYVEQLMKYIKVDSYGACLKNKDLPEKFKNDYLNNLNERDFLHFIARYKFVIAIENGACNDYVTEKFWRAIKVGTVPIYFGSPLIKDWLPNEKSAILLQDFPTPKILYEHIKELLENDNLYDQYLDHKTKRIISNEKLIDEHRLRPYQFDGLKIVNKFECHVCEKMHAKMNGDTSVNIVNKKHYDCPKPLSALTLGVNPANSWIYSWESAQNKAKQIYDNIINSD